MENIDDYYLILLNKNIYFELPEKTIQNKINSILQIISINDFAITLITLK